MSCYATLKSKGLRLTPQRRLIIDLIHEKAAHLTPEEIISYVHEKMPGLNKSTVYRTLELLESSGCVYKSELDHQTVYHHAEEGHHHHLVCDRCGQKLECEESITAPFEEALQQRYGFRVHLQHLVLPGLCRECQDKET